MFQPPMYGFKHRKQSSRGRSRWRLVRSTLDVMWCVVAILGGILAVVTVLNLLSHYPLWVR